MRKGVYLILLLVVIGVFGCGNNSKPAALSHEGEQPTTGKPPVNLNSPQVQSTNYDATDITVEKDSAVYRDPFGRITKIALDKDTILYGRSLADVVLNDWFNDRKLDKKDELKTWYGLFIDANKQCYLKGTKIKIETTVGGPDDDLPGETHQKVTANNRDSCLLLIGGINHLKEGLINLTDEDNWRGDIGISDTFSFGAKGNRVQIIGEGKQFFPSDLYPVFNYKVYVAGVKDGHAIKQLILALPRIISGPASIEWTGDIDGDGLPDFLIGFMYSDYAGGTMLYLSSLAKEGELLKYIGYQEVMDNC